MIKKVIRIFDGQRDIFGGNVLGNLCPRLFVKCCSEAGGMLNRLRGMDAPESSQSMMASVQHWVANPEIRRGEGVNLICFPVSHVVYMYISSLEGAKVYIAKLDGGT